MVQSNNFNLLLFGHALVSEYSISKLNNCDHISSLHEGSSQAPSDKFHEKRIIIINELLDYVGQFFLSSSVFLA